MKRRPLQRRIVPSIEPTPLTPEEVRAEFLELSEGGARVVCVGAARRNPKRLLSLGYAPRYKLELFGVAYYLSEVRQNADVRFFVAYLALRGKARGRPWLYARFLYKDGSLLWRSASHFAKSASENWIGKGDLKRVKENGREVEYSAEHTTDLPLELQAAIDSLTRRAARVRTDRRALALVVRRCNDTRIVAYADFTEPRRRAAANPRNLVNGGRPIACFLRENEPESLVFVPGFEPDFSAAGRIDLTHSHSRLYEGAVDRYRILSRNRRMQYLFFAAPRLVWLGYPQPLTTELSSFGVRTVDVTAPDDLVVPGMEYHYLETDDPPVWMSQIPPGFAGPVSPADAFRADASAWLDRLPVIAEFRERVLSRARGTGARGRRARASGPRTARARAE
ncbi:MAG TPA: hypothetical protein VKF60_13980 [Myxococcota bacterium]|nr:hypothetical protein [Myxococcota bacterium]